MLNRLSIGLRSRGGLIATLGLALSAGVLVALHPYIAIPPPFSNAITLLLEILFYSSFILLVVWLMLAAGLSKQSMRFWMFLTLVCVVYALGTRFDIRSYDSAGHRDYVDFIVTRHTVPVASDCWVCYHPPLYYLAAAPFYRVFKAMPDGSPAKGLQIFAVALFGLFLIYFLKIVEECLKGNQERMWAIVALAALPTTMINSARVGNDALLYAFWICAMFHAIRWERELKRRDLMIAAAALALGFITKASAIVPAVALMATLITVYSSHPDRRRDIVRHGAQAIALIGIACAAYLAWSRRFVLQGLSPNTGGLPATLKITQTAIDQIALDLRPYLTQFAQPHTDLGGRVYFWNFFLKTSLVGEWNHRADGALFAARILSAIYLALLAQFAWMMARSLKEIRKLPSMLVWSIAISPLFSLMYRWQGGFSCMGDARYVYPMFAAAAVAYVWLLDESRRNGRPRTFAIGVGILGAFILAGIGFETTILLSLL